MSTVDWLKIKQKAIENVVVTETKKLPANGWRSEGYQKLCKLKAMAQIKLVAKLDFANGSLNKFNQPIRKKGKMKRQHAPKQYPKIVEMAIRVRGTRT